MATELGEQTYDLDKDINNIHNVLDTAYSGGFLAAYGGYQGSDWQYYLRVKNITVKNGVIVSVANAQDVCIG